MEANWDRDDMVGSNDFFFYLYNWHYSNQIGLYSYKNNQHGKITQGQHCIGVWKVKTLKQK